MIRTHGDLATRGAWVRRHAVHARATGSALLLALGLAPRPSLAQPEVSHAITFGIGGGVSVPIAESREVFRHGFNGQAFVGVDLGVVPVWIRADFDYQDFDLRPRRFAPLTGPSGGTGTMVGGLASAQVFLARGPLRPYLLGGVGVFQVKTEVDSTAVPGRSDLRFGVESGAGVVLTIGTFSVYVEGRLDHVEMASNALPPGALRVIPFTVGVMF